MGKAEYTHKIFRMTNHVNLLKLSSLCGQFVAHFSARPKDEGYYGTKF